MTRDPVFVNSKLYVKGEGIYCKEKIIIEYPAWYEEKGLGSSQEVVSFYGIAALIIGSSLTILANNGPKIFDISAIGFFGFAFSAILGAYVVVKYVIRE